MDNNLKKEKNEMEILKIVCERFMCMSEVSDCKNCEYAVMCETYNEYETIYVTVN